MKRMMSIAAIALFMAGSSAFACDSCGCSAKKVEKKAACSACTAAKDGKKADVKKCGADCAKACCAKKADAKK
ncbi:hypothetical protein [Pontiella sulfatireligans]|uniref:Uncharacterized protein n=1 Tax=Pontiella sulfatireligans TaxID=2750658 RepID=A0A6C2US89_9BACT|nr:hypothetical protein [Pontiella sulfatireligans]VGO22999.1 hypothetical protein SCARR_05098 [Pontiella sulfatireligans]